MFIFSCLSAPLSVLVKQSSRYVCIMSLFHELYSESPPPPPLSLLYKRTAPVCMSVYLSLSLDVFLIGCVLSPLFDQGHESLAVCICVYVCVCDVCLCVWVYMCVYVSLCVCRYGRMYLWFFFNMLTPCKLFSEQSVILYYVYVCASLFVCRYRCLHSCVMIS